MSETIVFEIKDQIAVIKLNRPDSLNSINELMIKELRAAIKEIKEIKKSSARVLLFTGEGKGFCSGQDLSDRQVKPGAEETPDLGESLEKRYNPLIKELSALPLPIVCAVNGVAAGAGVSLVLSSDFILMAESSSLVLAFSKIGLVPDSGCSWFLAQSIGWRRARSLALLGERIKSSQALDWGLAWQVCPDSDLSREAYKMAERLRDMPTQGLGYIKRLFQSMGSDLHKQLEVEKDFQQLAGRTEDYREGVAAFLEKRKPRFSGE